MFEYSKLTEYIPHVDRVLCDIPSTAFFETIYSEKPVLALYRPKYQKIRSNAKRYFGNSLEPYNNTEEGLAVVSRFLNESIDKYVVQIPEVAEPIAEILAATLDVPIRGQVSDE